MDSNPRFKLFLKEVLTITKSLKDERSLKVFIIFKIKVCERNVYKNAHEIWGIIFTTLLSFTNPKHKIVFFILYTNGTQVCYMNNVFFSINV